MNTRKTALIFMIANINLLNQITLKLALVDKNVVICESVMEITPGSQERLREAAKSQTLL